MRKGTTTIPHPHDQRPVTMNDLGDEFGIHPRTIRSRWDDGKRGHALIKAPNAKLVEARRRREEQRRLNQITAQHERRLSLRAFLNSPAGRLTTAKRLGEYGRQQV